MGETGPGPPKTLARILRAWIKRLQTPRHTLREIFSVL